MTWEDELRGWKSGEISNRGDFVFDKEFLNLMSLELAGTANARIIMEDCATDYVLTKLTRHRISERKELGPLVKSMQFIGTGRGDYNEASHYPTPLYRDQKEVFYIFEMLNRGCDLYEAAMSFLDDPELEIDDKLYRSAIHVAKYELRCKITIDAEQIVLEAEIEATRIHKEITFLREKYEKTSAKLRAEGELTLKAASERAEQIRASAKKYAKELAFDTEAMLYDLKHEIATLEQVVEEYSIVRFLMKWFKPSKKMKTVPEYSYVKTLSTDEKKELDEYMSAYGEYAENKSN